MNLFRSYSTLKNNERFGDVIINTETNKLNDIRVCFDENDQSFTIKVEFLNGNLIEVHDTIEIARERINLILLAYGADLLDASKMANEMRFIKKKLSER